MTSPFFITGLPRSMTAWLANFFTHGAAYCGHDVLATCASLDALQDWFAERRAEGHDFVGISDSGLPLVADAVRERWPESRWLCVRRPLPEALESFMDAFTQEPYAGVPKPERAAAIAAFHSCNAKLDEMAAWPECMTTSMDQLSRVAALSLLWSELCGSLPFPHERAKMLRGFHLRVIPAVVRVDPEIFERLRASVNVEVCA